MYLSLNPTVVGRRVAWPDFARLAAKTGFPGVDVDLPAAQRAGLTATRQLFQDTGVLPAVCGFPTEFRKDEAAFTKSLAELEDAAQFAAAIGCLRMITYILPSSETPKAELRAIYLRRFQKSAAILARSHVRLGLEFLGPLHLRRANPHEFIWKMGEMLEFTKECGANVGLLLDSWHWHHAGATPEDIIAAGKDRIVHVHLNDAAAQKPEDVRDNERLMPGEGVENLSGFLRALKTIGYQDALSVEVFGRGLANMPPEEGARLALASGKKVLREAGIA